MEKSSFLSAKNYAAAAFSLAAVGCGSVSHAPAPIVDATERAKPERIVVAPNISEMQFSIRLGACRFLPNLFQCAKSQRNEVLVKSPSIMESPYRSLLLSHLGDATEMAAIACVANAEKGAANPLTEFKQAVVEGQNLTIRFRLATDLDRSLLRALGAGGMEAKRYGDVFIDPETGILVPASTVPMSSILQFLPEAQRKKYEKMEMTQQIINSVRFVVSDCVVRVENPQAKKEPKSNPKSIFGRPIA